MNNVNYNKNNFKYFLLLAVIVTNLSQIPFFVDNQLTKLISVPVWILIFNYIIFNNLIKISKNILFYLFLWGGFICYIFILEVFKQGKYLGSVFVYPYTICVFILCIGYFLSNKINKNDFKLIAKGYIYSGILVTLCVYLDSFKNKFSWDNMGYIYGSKNSVSQIILTTIILLAIYIQPKNKREKAIKITTILLVLIQLLMLRSRASILGLGFIIYVLLFLDRRKKNFKKSLTIVLILFSFLLLINNQFYDFFINNIILNGKVGTDINTISSGRLDMIVNQFFHEFPSNLFLGKGECYIESFPFSVFLHYGIIGGSLLLIFSLMPLIYCIYILKKNDEFNISFCIISLSYIFNGIFEQQAPLGPGTKNYLLWLMFGFTLGWIRLQKSCKI